MKNLVLRPTSLLYIAIGVTYFVILLLVPLEDSMIYLWWVFSLMINVLKIRFNRLSQYYYIEFVIYGLAIYFLDASIIYMMLPSLMLSMYDHAFYPIGLIGLTWMVFDISNIVFLILFMTLTALAYILLTYKSYKVTHQKALDQLRKTNYLLETEHLDLLKTQNEISYMSMIEERDRIAQKLHDDLGHELTGALIALRAYKTVRSDDFNESLETIENRLKNAVESLKDTVSDTKVEQHYGFERFNKMIDSFEDVPIDFIVEGVFSELSSTHWQTLNNVLKEALTNVLKHSEATFIQIELKRMNKMVRFTIKNDGVHQSSETYGMGLKYMRKRIEALNGSLNIQKDYYFTLRVVLPIILK